MVVDLAHSATELLLAPLDLLPAWLELLVISALTGVIALLAVKYTTHQQKLERSRDLMTSTIYEMRLFMDSPRRVLSAQRRLVWHSLGYVGRTLPALAVMMVPLTLLFLHLELRFSYQAAKPRALVQVEVAEGASAADVRIDLEGRVPVLGPVVDPEANVAYFRIDLPARSSTSFDVELKDARTAKLLIADPGADRISAERTRGWESSIALGYEAAIPSELPFERIAVDHERDEREILWMPWWVTWLVASIAAAFLLKKPLRVAI